MSVLVLDVLCETGAFSRPASDFLRAYLLKRGLDVRIGHLRFGVIKGVRALDVVVNDARELGVPLVRAGVLTFDIDTAALCSGKVQPRAVAFSDSTVFLPFSEDAGVPAKCTAVHGVRADLHLGDAEIQIVAMQGTFGGLRVSLDGVVAGLGNQEEDVRTPQGKAGDGLSWLARFRALTDRHRAAVQPVLAFVAQNTFPEPDAGLEIHADVRLDAPEKTLVTGAFNLPDLVAKGIAVRKLKGDIEIEGSTVRVKPLGVFIDNESTLQGWLKLADVSGDIRFSGELRGRLGADTVLRMLPGDTLPDPAWLTASEPAEITATLKPSSLALTGLDATARLDWRGFRCKQLAVQELRVDATLQAGVVTVRTVDVGLSGADRVTASGTVSLVDRVFSAEIDGRCGLTGRAADLGFAAKAAVSTATGRVPDSFHITIPRTSFDLKRFRATGNAVIDAANVYDLALTGIVANLEFTPDMIRVAEISACSARDTQAPVATGSITVDRKARTVSADFAGGIALSDLRRALPEGRSRDALAGLGSQPVTYTLRLPSAPLDPAKWTIEGDVSATNIRYQHLVARSVQGNIAWNPAALRFTDTCVVFTDATQVSASGSLDRKRERLTATVKGRASTTDLATIVPGVPAERFLQRVDSEAIRFSLDLADCPLAPRQWTFTGKLSADKGRFDELEFTHLGECDFAWSPGKLTVQVPEATLRDGGELRNCTIEVMKDKALSIKVTGDGVADPRFARTFIGGERLKEFYENIWKDFRWNPGKLPVLSLKSLHFRSNREKNEWGLDIEGAIRAEDCGYRTVKAKSLAATVVLHLPREVTISNIEVCTAEGNADGELVFKLDDTPRCKIKCKGRFDPWMALLAINGDWEPFRARFPFAPDSDVAFAGTIPLTTVATLEMGGTVRTRSLATGKLSFDDVFGQWAWAGGKLWISAFEAGLHDGRFSGSGSYNFSARKGDIEFDAKRVNLQKLASAFGDTDKFKSEGVLTSKCDLDIYSLDEKICLDGTGTLKLSESNLWEIPFFSLLTGILKLPFLDRLSGLGRITQVKADLVFEKDAVKVPKLLTDGTIIALAGDGQYSWRSQALDFRLLGRVLPRTLIVPIALDIFSRAFEVDLEGTVKEPKWKMIGGIRKALPSIPGMGKDKDEGR